MKYDTPVRLLALAGLILSGYAVYVEDQKSRNPNFEALCDFGTFSCSKVFTSAYGHVLFGVPNAVFGCLFYVAVMLQTVLTFIPFKDELLYAATIGAGIFSVILAYLLSSLGDICVLCISTYFINFSLLYLAYKRVGVKNAKATKKTK